ncbi:hypothetical protein UXN85_20975 [Enterobacter hormaechei]
MAHKFIRQQVETSRRAAVVRSLLKSGEGASPFFENTPGIEPVAQLWTEALRAYKSRTGKLPHESILANAHAALERQLNNSKAMFEASDMSTSGGVLSVPVWGAFILPAMLESTTATLCTFVDASHDLCDVLSIYPVVSKGFGDYAAGTRLDGSHAGRFSSMRRFMLLDAADQPKNGKKVFTFDTTWSINGVLPIRPGTIRLAIDRVPYPVDFDNSSTRASQLSGTGKLAGATFKIDYENATVEADLTNANAAFYADGVILGLEWDIDEETAPAIIPEIALREESARVRQTRYLLAAQYTMQAVIDLQREQGLSLESELVNNIIRWMAGEQDTRRLRTVLFYNKLKTSIDTSRKTDNLGLWAEALKRRIIEESDKLQALNKSVGITGAYAGEKAAQLFRSFPGHYFQADPDFYTTSGLRRAGTLFGSIEVFVVPDACCDQLVTEPESTFKTNDVLFFGSDAAGHSPLVAGDGIPPTQIQHAVTPSLRGRVTLYGTELNAPNPHGGGNFQVLATLENL